MGIKVGESGKVVRVAAGFDMSNNTELQLVFTAPSGGTDFTVAKADGVTIGTGVTDPTLGALSADEYVEYECTSTNFDKDGTWSVYLKYTNTGETPDDIFHGDLVTFTVGKAAS